MKCKNGGWLSDKKGLQAKLSSARVRDLEMTHQIGIRNTLHEERFYVDGALVIASSLRNTEIKRILSVWSLEAFLRLLGRFREMTRGP